MGKPTFSVGDIVEAVVFIKREDGINQLRRGQFAKVVRIWDTDNAQIVDVEVGGLPPICNIVCFEDSFPLKYVSNPQLRRDERRGNGYKNR